MTIYIVESWDYESNHIEGVFMDESVARKCLGYHLLFIEIKNKHDGGYGRDARLQIFDTSDHVDFDEKLAVLLESERLKEQQKYETIKQKDLEEYNRIKEKYGL